MKKRVDWKSLGIIAGGLAAVGGVLAAAVLLLVLSVSLPMLAGLSMLAETEDELLFTSSSPDGAYVLEAYRVNTAAIEPFMPRSAWWRAKSRG